MNRILAFHQVYNYKWFDDLVGYLYSKYEMVSMDDINNYYHGNLKLNSACHITVDDGEKSFCDVILPVLKKYKVPATLYVSPKIISERLNYWFQEISDYDPVKLMESITDVTSIPNESLARFNPIWILKTLKIKEILQIIERYQSLNHISQKPCRNITIQDVKDLDQSGLIAIGAHSMNHPILRNEDDTVSVYEVRESVSELSGILNHSVRYFAYPNGYQYLDFTEREEQTLRINGIQLAVTTEPGNLSSKDNVMRIPRLVIPEGQPPSVIKAKLMLAGSWNKLRKIKPQEELKQRLEIARHGL